MLETSLWYPLPVLPTPAETCAAPHLLTLFTAFAEPINGNHCNKDIHTVTIMKQSPSMWAGRYDLGGDVMCITNLV